MDKTKEKGEVYTKNQVKIVPVEHSNRLFEDDKNTSRQ